MIKKQIDRKAESQGRIYQMITTILIFLLLFVSAYPKKREQALFTEEKLLGITIPQRGRAAQKKISYLRVACNYRGRLQDDLVDTLSNQPGIETIEPTQSDAYSETCRTASDCHFISLEVNNTETKILVRCREKGIDDKTISSSLSLDKKANIPVWNTICIDNTIRVIQTHFAKHRSGG